MLTLDQLTSRHRAMRKKLLNVQKVLNSYGRLEIQALTVDERTGDPFAFASEIYQLYHDAGKHAEEAIGLLEEIERQYRARMLVAGPRCPSCGGMLVDDIVTWEDPVSGATYRFDTPNCRKSFVNTLADTRQRQAEALEERNR